MATSTFTLTQWACQRTSERLYSRAISSCGRSQLWQLAMAHFSNFQDWGVAVDDRQEGVKCWWKSTCKWTWLASKTAILTMYVSLLITHNYIINNFLYLYTLCCQIVVILLTFVTLTFSPGQETELRSSHVYSASASACACGGQWQGTLLLWSQAAERGYRADVIMYGAVTWMHCYRLRKCIIYDSVL